MLYFSNAKVRGQEKTLHSKQMMKTRLTIIETIENVDFSKQRMDFSRCENMAFVHCHFPDFGNIDFTDCLFEDCNLSNVKFNNCKLDNVEFYDCKMVGASFTQTKDFAFEAHFFNSNLDYSVFDRKKLNKSTFAQCRFHEANFTQTDFTKAKLSQCDFTSALFDKTNLTGVDMRSCSNFLIDPTQNFIKKAKFRAQDLAGLLYRFDIQIS